MKRFVLFLFFIHFSFLAFSQSADTVPSQKDSLKNNKRHAAKDTSYIRRRANRAALYSAVLPGLGQAYNKKYWKIPILYGGIVSLAIAINFNNQEYQSFKNAYIDAIKGIPNPYINIYPDSSALLVRRDYYRRSRDLLYIFAGAVYVLNIIDAYVDAHLINFDVSDNLSLYASPSMQMTCNAQPIASLSLTLSFH